MSLKVQLLYNVSFKINKVSGRYDAIREYLDEFGLHGYSVRQDDDTATFGAILREETRVKLEEMLQEEGVLAP